MTLKTVYSQYHQKHVRFGRKRPPSLGPHLKLGRYLKASLPPAPDTSDFTAKAIMSLSNIYGNDSMGDCVVAGGYHVEGVETGNAGICYVASDQQIVADYSAIGGYVPGDPSTDNGCDEVTALNFWSSKGFANGTKLLGWLTVDAHDKEELKSAQWLFENLFFGMELPEAWVTPMPSVQGFVWDVAGNPVPENGHCVIGAGATTSGIIIATWGMLGTLTFDAIAKYACQSNGGEVYVLISPDQLAKGADKCPNGVAWSDLVADFDKIGGSVAIPQPPAPPFVPPPLPPPLPPPIVPPPSQLVSLDDAKRWVTAGLSAGPSLMGRGHAIGIANTALAKNWPQTP